MTDKKSSRWAAILGTPVGACAGALLLGALVLAVFAPMFWSGQANAVDTNHLLEGASWQHWSGTDSLGRDIFFRVLVATRLSIGLALLATAIGLVVGILVGAAPAVLGQRTGRFVTAVVNIAVAFPGLLLALFFAVVFGVGAKGAVLAIGFAMAPSFARLTQTLVATVAGRDFVSAARIVGIGRVRLLLRHILPNVGDPLVVTATIGAGNALLAFSGLSFLGLGVQAPAYDWGRLLGEGLDNIYIHPEAALAPGLAVVLVGLAFNLFGEAVAKGIGGRTALVRVGASDPTTRLAEAEADPSTSRNTSDSVLTVEDLRVTFPGPDGPLTPVRGISFTVGRGEVVGVVGESGSGKSLTALAVAQLIESPGSVDAGRLEFLGTSLLDDAQVDGAERQRRRKLLGTSFAMVFQDPATSFNPTMKVGRQLAEVSQQHQKMSRKQSLEHATDRLKAVRLPAPERRAAQLPHEFSGGMLQRAMIGMGVMGSPALIVADEPTTALDVTVQRQVLRLLNAIREADNVAILLISHDITVVGQMCDRVLVMYAGRIVEDLPADQLRTGARHPYTRALLAAVPDMKTDLEQPLAVIPGKPVSPSEQPVGCAFAARCPFVDEKCVAEDPELVTDPQGKRVACWHPQDGPTAVTLELTGTGIHA